MQHRLRYLLLPGTKQYDLVIIDDYIPNAVAGFRGSEFSYLMKEIPNSALFSIIGSKIDGRKDYQYFNIKSNEQFNKSKEAFTKVFDVKDEQVNPFHGWTKINSKLIYIVFLTNAYYLIDYLEKRGIKFILELYPGGNFCTVTEGPAYEQLKRVLGSPMLEKVIVTQKNSLQFVLDNNLCAREKVTFIYGVILSEDFLDLPPKQIMYPLQKNTVDICFTAAKYMPRGLDKGYDIFIDMAHLLLATGSHYHFHIVGGFNEADVPINSKYRDNFHFYGFLKGKEFTEFYKDKDIFVSPSRANTLAKGAFDGFPTAACAEAGLHGLCLILSDPLALNMVFSHDKDTIIPQNNPVQIAEIIINLAANPEEIYSIGEKGKRTIQAGFGHEAQMVSRLSAITQSLQKMS